MSHADPSSTPPQGVARRIDAAAAERRRRIVDAALQLFSECDYDAVQMDEVARIAGVAKPTLYRYFPTKEALFLEGIERILTELQHDVELAGKDPATAPEALRSVIRCVFLALARCTAAIHAFDGADAQLGERGRGVIRSRVRSIRVVLEHILSRGVAEGAFRDVDEALTAVTILGSIRMSAAQASARRRPVALRLLTDFIERGISAVPRHDTVSGSDGGDASGRDPSPAAQMQEA